MASSIALSRVSQIQADTLSWVGQTLAMEWAINRQLLHMMFSTLGIPGIDLFTSLANRKLPVFASPFPDLRDKCVYAMSVPWPEMGMVYAFPLFKMLPTVLNKIYRAHNPWPWYLHTWCQYHGCRSYWHSLAVFPYYWMHIHFLRPSSIGCYEFHWSRFIE